MKDSQTQTIQCFIKKNKSLLVFFFCLAIIFGPAFTLFSEYAYDLSINPDIDTYLNLAEFDFNQSAVRKYRVIVPFLAALVNFILGPLFTAIEPWSFSGSNFSLAMSFFIVNSLLMSLYGLLIFKLLKAHNVSDQAAILGLLAILSSRWVAYFAGLPLVDSLYLCIIGALLLALKTKNVKLIIICIFIGPWAKESFVFFVPLILFYAPVNLWKQIMMFGFSAIIVFTFRYYLDTFTGAPINASLMKDLDHFDQISFSIQRLFSFHGIYELFSIVGVWMILFLSFFNKSFRKVLSAKIPKYTIPFLVIILFHALLSTELARMFYLASPIIAIVIALIVEEIFNLLQVDKVH